MALVPYRGALMVDTDTGAIFDADSGQWQQPNGGWGPEQPTMPQLSQGTLPQEVFTGMTSVGNDQWQGSPFGNVSTADLQEIAPGMSFGVSPGISGSNAPGIAPYSTDDPTTGINAVMKASGFGGADAEFLIPWLQQVGEAAGLPSNFDWTPYVAQAAQELVSAQGSGFTPGSNPVGIFGSVIQAASRDNPQLSQYAPTPEQIAQGSTFAQQRGDVYSEMNQDTNPLRSLGITDDWFGPLATMAPFAMGGGLSQIGAAGSGAAPPAVSDAAMTAASQSAASNAAGSGLFEFGGTGAVGGAAGALPTPGAVSAAQSNAFNLGQSLMNPSAGATGLDAMFGPSPVTSAATTTMDDMIAQAAAGGISDIGTAGLAGTGSALGNQIISQPIPGVTPGFNEFVPGASGGMSLPDTSSTYGFEGGLGTGLGSAAAPGILEQLTGGQGGGGTPGSQGGQGGPMVNPALGFLSAGLYQQNVNQLMDQANNWMRDLRADNPPYRSYDPMVSDFMRNPQARQQMLQNTPGYQASQNFIQQAQQRRNSATGQLGSGYGDALTANVLAQNAQGWDKQIWDQLSSSAGLGLTTAPQQAGLAQSFLPNAFNAQNQAAQNWMYAGANGLPSLSNLFNQGSNNMNFGDMGTQNDTSWLSNLFNQNTPATPNVTNTEFGTSFI